MMRASLFVLVACSARPAPIAPVPAISQHPTAPVLPARLDLAVSASPMGLVVVGATLVWTDSAGAVWTMPATGGTPHQLSDQHGAGFAFHPVLAGDRAFVTTHRDLFRVALPDGPVERVGVPGLPEDPEEAAGDDAAIYVTLFKRDAVYRIPVDGGAPTKLLDFKRGVLAIHGATLYLASYTSGALVAVPTAGGKPRTIARGLARPTALAVDDTAAFVYTERDQAVHRIELATGRMTTLAEDLVNSDHLVADGAWLYTYSWDKHHQVVRLAKDGSRRDVLADDLGSPYAIAVSVDAIYITSRDQSKIVRFAK